MKSPATMFMIFSIGFAIIALFFPADDVQQGQAIGLALFLALLCSLLALLCSLLALLGQ